MSARHCEDCTRPIWGADGVPSVEGRGELHRACAERLAQPRGEDRESGVLEFGRGEQAECY